MTLIAPVWPTQSWYPTLLRLLIAHPILLPQTDATFLTQILENGEEIPWKNAAAWRLSGNDTDTAAYLKMLQRVSPNSVSEPNHSVRASRDGTVGLAGVLLGAAIPWSRISLAL